MSERQTYTERRSYSARVMKWRKAIYHPRSGLTNGCRVMLLRLSDDMDAKCIVSIPRTVLAEDLGVAPARISEYVKQARALGFLDIVKRARQHSTAVYQGIRPSPEVREGVPLSETESASRGTAEPTPVEVRQGVPLRALQRYALTPTQEVVAAAGIETATETTAQNDGYEERACEWCGSAVCDRDCLGERVETARRRIG